MPLYVHNGILCRNVPTHLREDLLKNGLEVESKRRDWVLYTDLVMSECTFKEVLKAKNSALVRISRSQALSVNRVCAHRFNL
jgi:hypothetical protein